MGEKNLIKQLEKGPEIPERLEVKEITFENLTNEDILKAVLVWYKEGNTLLDLARMWGEEKWKKYQDDPEKFIREESYKERNMEIKNIKRQLEKYGHFNKKLGFKI